MNRSDASTTPRVSRADGAPHFPALDAAQERALALVRGSQRFLLFGHQKPDGDCLGSQAAFARLLQRMGKDVWVLNPDPPEERYDYLARHCRFTTYQGGELPTADVLVTLDFSEPSRTAAMAPLLLASSAKKLVIDHHLHYGDVWWNEAFVDVSASATALLVHRMARALEIELDPVLATAIFTGLVTDTGWFKYGNTDAETLRAAGELCAAGVVPAEIFAAVYQRRALGYPPFVSRLLSRLEYAAEGRLAVVDLPLAAGTDAEALDGDEVMDILRSVESVEVVLYLRELKRGGTKLSARSKTEYDVNALAREFGGGGHKKASGATIEGTFDDVRARVVASAIERFGALARPK